MTEQSEMPKGTWYPNSWICRCEFCGAENQSDKPYVTLRCTECNRIFTVVMHAGHTLTVSRDYLI